MYKIAITGKANTGKNTLSKMLIKQLRVAQNKYMWGKCVAFADPIKEMIRIMFPELPRKFLFGSSKYRNEIIPGAMKNGVPLTVRQLLLDLGTEMGRGYKESVWLDNFDNRYSKYANTNNKNMVLIVTDVRFRNEFEHLAKKGFYQIRLYRDDGTPGINHVSETNQNSIFDNEFNYVLDNNGSLNELKAKVSDIVSLLRP